MVARWVVSPRQEVGAPRHPSERLIEAGVGRGPHPADLAPAQPADLGVVAELLEIVEGEEVSAKRREEGQHRARGHEKNRQKIASLRPTATSSRSFPWAVTRFHPTPCCRHRALTRRCTHRAGSAPAG